MNLLAAGALAGVFTACGVSAAVSLRPASFSLITLNIEMRTADCRQILARLKTARLVIVSLGKLQLRMYRTSIGTIRKSESGIRGGSNVVVVFTGNGRIHLAADC